MSQMEAAFPVAPGYYADLVVFNAELVDSPATYEDPERPPIGIQSVFHNGARIL